MLSEKIKCLNKDSSNVDTILFGNRGCKEFKLNPNGAERKNSAMCCLNCSFAERVYK